MLLATDVADYLVGRGVPFRRAHEIVGALVRKLVAEGRDFGRSRSRNGARPATCSTPDVVTRVTPAVVGGGQADAAVDRAVAVAARLVEARG